MAAQGFPVALTCRILQVSTSGYYEWRTRPACDRDRHDAELANTITAIHTASRQTYGVRRIQAELRHGHGIEVSHKRVWRCMKLVGVQGVHRRRWRREPPAAASWPDLVQRQFRAEGPDRLWVTDITQHRTCEGWIYAAVVLDVYSRRVVGWSIADHLRTELVADALDMARLRRKPVGTVVHSDRGTQYTSWLFGHRLREAGLLGSMGRVASAFDNAMIESFFGSMQIELLDRRTWNTRAELATAIFEYIEAFYNPVRRHSALDYRSPIDYERHHTTTNTAA
ncbi:IS3 family transposase [Mycobacterium kubicae]|uniref:IS3 family transposase n=1 Tax=Mycobacterium kubicae TaxID=120959 RepID=UPI003B8A69AA